MIFLPVHKNMSEAKSMEEVRCENRRKTAPGVWLSRGFLALALAAVVATCRLCMPQAGQAIRGWLGLEEGGRVQAAFSALQDALAGGQEVASAFAESYLVLTGETP